jgi:hypothetical protein
VGQRVDGQFCGRFLGECAERSRRCSGLGGRWGDSVFVSEAIALGHYLSRLRSHEHVSLPEAKMQTDLQITIIEIRPYRNGWEVYEAPGVQPVFLNQEQAIDYATGRACFRSGEIRILNSNGAVERVILFTEAGRKL